MDKLSDLPVIIVGNCIAGMVAALELGRAGQSVVLVNPSPVWGGHFSSKVINDKPFDLGMVGFEFTGFHSSPTEDVRAYDVRQRNNVARFCGLSRRYVESLIPVNQSRTPLMLWEDRVVPDVLMGNDLAVLELLPRESVQAIEDEVNAILGGADRTLHARGKVDNPRFLAASYEEASVANHGKTFHELFVAPFADRLFPGGASRFSAIYHRCLWMPLYYPETLLAAIRAQPHDITTLFHYPAAGRIGALADALLDALKATANVQIVTTAIHQAATGEGVSLFMADGSVLKGRSLVWGLDLSSLLRFTGTGNSEQQNMRHTKTSAAFGFFVVDRKRLSTEFSSLFVLDRKRLIYRITNLSDSGGTDEDEARLVLELDSHHFSDGVNDPERLSSLAVSELVELGIVDDDASVVSRKAYAINDIMPVPKAEDHARFWENHDFVAEAHPNVLLIGPSSGYLITTMNDQIVQGLKVAKELAA